MQFKLKVAVLECSFLKHSQGILGLKNHNYDLREPHGIVNAIVGTWWDN